MGSHRTRAALGLGLALALLGAAGCKREGGPLFIVKQNRDAGGGSGGGVDLEPAVVASPAGVCRPARAPAIPARAAVTSAEVKPAASEKPVFVTDLFGLFKSHCGACHVDTKLGNYQVTQQTFAKEIDARVVGFMKTDDVAKVMPPPAAGGKPYSQRGPNDPIVQLVAQVERWIAAGKPPNVFYLPAEAQQASDGSPFLLAPEVGARLTQLGDCVPDAALVGVEKKNMQELDAFFAAAKELPARLEETDLSTLDGETLARHGVVAYAPTYPLWADDAGKLRHVRVPVGQAVRLGAGKESQAHDVPPNTRFYKTFLKKIVDADGTPRYRKIETRLIVARPDVKRPDGTVEATALFGTYVWNEEETEAVLLADPLRNGKPFRDRLITYVVDEPKAQKIRDGMPANLTYALEVENPGLLRKYAIPGSERCVQCHMGSESGSFILGFSPVQVARRPQGHGGVTEPVGEDELTQLERLAAYGIVKPAAAEIAPLEASQGSRKPRNEHELVAQGYLVGNCAHCHNARGFPSVKNPELRTLLDFQPSAQGGIFQFPLDATSPRIKRGANQDVPIPYITPSLREYPVGAVESETWKPKWVDCKERPEFCGGKTSGVLHVDAPWRSLIYRNVDGPFTYAEDFAIFPHMPMHAPGFDCRAPQILGDWMVSIPAVRKNPATDEDAVPPKVAGSSADAKKVDTSAQPYEEVKPGDPRYAMAVADAEKRLEAYHAGRRYGVCPDTTDIVDRAVFRRETTALVPADEDV